LLQVSLDSVEVSHFISDTEFVVRSEDPKLKVGNILLGSLRGPWSRTPGSAAGILRVEPKHFKDGEMLLGEASKGGLAHLSVIRNAVTLPSGGMKVSVSHDVREKVFHSGRIALGWNHTEVKKRRRSNEEIDILLGGSHPEHRRLYNPGVCDLKCIEGQQGEFINSLSYDRLGGCNYDVFGYCTGSILSCLQFETLRKM
jgi:hypothetical protein